MPSIGPPTDAPGAGPPGIWLHSLSSTRAQLSCGVEVSQMDEKILREKLEEEFEHVLARANQPAP